MLNNLLLVFHVLVAIGIVGLVLMQQGKGADAGAAFGGGSSSTVFGSQGSGTFLSRATAVLAAIFFVTSLSLAYLAKDKVTASDEFSETFKVQPKDTDKPAAVKETSDSDKAPVPLDNKSATDTDKPAKDPVPNQNLPID